MSVHLVGGHRQNVVGCMVSSFLVYDLLTERSIVEFVSLGETVRYGSKEKECGKSVGGGDNLCS